MKGSLRSNVKFALLALRRAGLLLWRAFVKYNDTDGEQRAASFAYYAFFALIPLILLLVSIGSMFVHDKAQVANVIISQLRDYLPMTDDAEETIIKTINGVVNSWKAAGAIAVLAIVWSALGLFHALVRGVNRAWGTLEYPWWRLPIKNLFMIGVVISALVIGVIAPAILKAVEAFAWRHNIPTLGVKPLAATFKYAGNLVPTLVLFYALTMFYKFAPRRRTTFAEVWLAALVAAVLLQVLQNLFVVYAKNYYNFNRLYGAFGGVVAFLLWIYLSGSVIIFGGCLSAAQNDRTKAPPEDDRAE